MVRFLSVFTIEQRPMKWKFFIQALRASGIKVTPELSSLKFKIEFETEQLFQKSLSPGNSNLLLLL